MASAIGKKSPGDQDRVIVPKRESPYNEFVKAELTRIKTENPELDHKDAFKLACSRWKTRPQTQDAIAFLKEERQRQKQEFQEQQDRYLELVRTGHYSEALEELPSNPTCRLLLDDLETFDSPEYRELARSVFHQLTRIEDFVVIIRSGQKFIATLARENYELLFESPLFFRPERFFSELRTVKLNKDDIDLIIDIISPNLDDWLNKADDWLATTKDWEAFARFLLDYR